jgi:hypothetical protein
LEGEAVLTGIANSRTFLNMVTRNPDGEIGGSPRSPKLLLSQSDYSIVSMKLCLHTSNNYFPSSRIFEDLYT